VGVVIFQAGIVSSSVLMRPYDEWRIAGEIGREYLASLRPCLERVPPGTRVEVANAPDSIATTTPDRVLIHAGILGPYSVGPAVRLVMPDVAPPDIYAHPLTQLSGMPSGVSSRCMLEDGAWLIRTEYLP
jgi:hypothetical protein